MYNKHIHMYIYINIYMYYIDIYIHIYNHDKNIVHLLVEYVVLCAGKLLE